MSMLSLLKEIEALTPKRSSEDVIEEKASHAFSSVRKLFQLALEEYGRDDAADLAKRFINSVKSGDFRKFKRGIDRLRRKQEQ